MHLARALLALIVAVAAAVVLAPANAQPPTAQAAADWPAGTFRWEGEFKGSSAGLPLHFTAQTAEPLPNGIGEFKIGGINAVLSRRNACRHRGRRLNGLLDFFAARYTTVTLGTSHKFAFRRRSPDASSGPGRFRIAGRFNAAGTRVSGTVSGSQRQVLGRRCKASGRFTAKRTEQLG